MLKRLAIFILTSLSAILLSAQELQQLNQQVVDLYKKGEYRKAIPFAEKAVTLTGKTFGENHPNYIRILNILVIIYMKSGEYAKAEPAAIKCTEIWKKNTGEFSSDFIASMNILGMLYNTMGQYAKAEKILLQGKESEKRSRGENSLAYATILDYLGRVYVEMQSFEKAEPVLLQAKDIRKRLGGTKHSGYESTLIELANLYRAMRDYEKAIAICIEARDIKKELLGEEHHEYITSQLTLAMLYIDFRQPSKAEPLLLKALESIKKVDGEMHRDYAATLSILGNLYLTTGRAAQAEHISMQSFMITKKIFGENHPLYAKALNNLGVIYKNMQDYKKAEAYYIQAKEVTGRLWGKDHLEYASCLANMATFYASFGEYEKSIPLVVAENNINLSSITNNFSVMSDKEKTAYLQKSIYPFDFANSLLFQLKNSPTQSALLARENYNHLLILKSMALSDSRNVFETIRNQNDPELNALFHKWAENKQVLAKQYALPVAYRRPDVNVLSQQTESWEKELNMRSNAFRQKHSIGGVTIKDVQDKLKSNEASVEFIRFQLYDKDWKDSMLYAAYILKKDDPAPVFVVLCEEKQLLKLFREAGSTISMRVNNIYRGASESTTSVLAGDSLYKLTWQPLEPFLKGVNTISYSPTGLLYNIAFNALPYAQGGLLMDKYRLLQVTSSRIIATRSGGPEPGPKQIVLFGDATFTLDSTDLAKQKNISAVNIKIPAAILRGNNNTNWKQLPGTGEEVKKIQALFLRNKIASMTYTKSFASEENLKLLSGTPVQAIHISTHGFFLPAPAKNKKDKQVQEPVYSMADDPLIRSGLIFSGANYAWMGKIPLDGTEDGICTAYEISQMNLSNTQLVVLSACETALGDIQGSEGVFGLQRGFKMAGVKNMIVSLWQVPDKETAELMTLFYTHWLNKKNIGESFYQAQTEMRKKYPPFYWAAFVLVE